MVQKERKYNDLLRLRDLLLDLEPDRDRRLLLLLKMVNKINKSTYTYNRSQSNQHTGCSIIGATFTRKL